MNSTPMATMALAALTLTVAMSMEGLAPLYSGATGGIINDSRVPVSSPAHLFGGRKSKRVRVKRSRSFQAGVTRIY